MRGHIPLLRCSRFTPGTSRRNERKSHLHRLEAVWDGSLIALLRWDFRVRVRMKARWIRSISRLARN